MTDDLTAPDATHYPEEPLTAEELALADHFRHLDCGQVVDPVDLEDCGGMAVEILRFLSARGWRAGVRPMAEPIVDQPPPTPNDQPAIIDLVIADLTDRKAVGIQRYGVPLQAHNGRDALIDAYQEALDLAAYLRQAIEERDGQQPYPTADADAYDAACAALERHRQRADAAEAGRDRLAAIVGKVRELVLTEGGQPLHPSKRVPVTALLAALSDATADTT